VDNTSETVDVSNASDDSHDMSMSDGQKNDISEPPDGSDGNRDGISYHDVSDGHCGDVSEPLGMSDEPWDTESEHHDVSANCAITTCDTSNSGIMIGNGHEPGSETHMKTLADSEYGAMASAIQEDPITRQDLMLPSNFATAGSQMPQLSGALEWESSAIGGNNNTSGFSYGSTPGMTPMGTSEANFDVIEPGAGVLGEQNAYGDYYGGSWAGWVTNPNKQSISFLDPMPYGPEYAHYWAGPYLPADLPQLEMVQQSGASVSPGLISGLASSPVDLPREEERESAGTSHGPECSISDPLSGLASSPVDLPREEERESAGTSHGPEHSISDPLPLSSQKELPQGEQHASTGMLHKPKRSALSSKTVSLLIPDNSDALAHPHTTPTPANEESRAPGEKSSRFGRTITPSTRLEKMNEIGSSKENIPPVASQQSKEWITSAKKHLLRLDLGEEWKSCVNAWLAIEESLDSGVKAKVRITSRFSSPNQLLYRAHYHLQIIDLKNGSSGLRKAGLTGDNMKSYRK
jgi:hypothetical protein